MFSQQDEHRTQMKLISKYMSVPHWPEAELITVADRKVDGSCIWLTDRSSFHDWFEGSKGYCELDPLDMPDGLEMPRYFWLSGKPGTGKSTAAGHVIRYLEECNCDYSFYFFKHSDRESSNVADLLRSLAYQMAYVNFEIRQAILAMAREGEHFNKDDYNTIWRIFFLTRICRIELQRPHYWVIDALDECNKYAILFQLLSKIDKSFPLRVFLTSRPLPLIQRLFVQEKISVFEEQIMAEDTLKDIELFLHANTHFLPVEDELACKDLITQILQKCNGCFLWAAVALRKLETIHSEEQIRDVLKNVPAEMDDLYTRILEGIAAVPSNVEIAKSILRWTVCATRPLTTEELKEALRLDINHVVPRLESVIESICGHLIYVDNQSRVQTVHETVRVFLTRQGLNSEFAIDRRKEHSRLAEVCLAYLSGKELDTPRTRRGKTIARPTKRSAFASYASFHFSEHLTNSSSAVDAPLILLDLFLKSNVLTWIESIAEIGDLSPLTRTAKNLKSYLDRRAKYRSPLGTEVQAVEAWANDLIRLGAAFGRNLLTSPVSIHFLTPPICPPHSVIYQSFANYPRCLKVLGRSDEGWDDRLSCINYSEKQALSIACRDGYFAVGLSDGSIMVHRSTTFEDVKKLNHGEPVRHLAFATLNTILASSGPRKVLLWNTRTGALIWAINIRVQLQPMALSFNEDDSVLMLATKENYIAFFKVTDGTKLEDCPFYDMLEDEEGTGYRHPPWNAQFSRELNLLAVSYRNRPITLWDLETKNCLGQFQKHGAEDVYPAPQTNHIVFNPNPELSLVAAAYNDGDLIVFDPWNLNQMALFEITVQVLAASPDGRFLATGDMHGTIHLFNFETLRLVYRITTYDYGIRDILFTSNSHRFFDIRGDHCNVWEPSILMQRDSSDDCSSEPYSEEIPPFTLSVEAKLWDDDRTITAITDHHGGDFLFCGREDGSIAVYEAKTGKVLQELCSHAKMVSIRFLSWNSQEGSLTSTDASSRFTVRRVARTKTGAWKAQNPILERRASQAIVQILMSPSGKQLLVSTASYDEAWSLEGCRLDSNQVAQRVAWSWMNHPSNPDYLLLVEDTKIHVYEWSRFKITPRAEGISLHISNQTEFLLEEAWPARQGHNICLRVSKAPESDEVPELQIWNASNIRPNAAEVQSIASYKMIGGAIKVIVGVYKSLLLFLDVNGWVCSIDVGGVRQEISYTRHFFIPFTWHSVGELLFRTTAKGTVAFARRDELVVFQGGIDFVEKVVFDSPKSLLVGSGAPQRRRSAGL